MHELNHEILKYLTWNMIIPVIPTLAKERLIIVNPLQLIPDHVALQGSVLVSPSEVQDHIVLPRIDSIFVAAIKLHIASSWKEGHVSNIVEGRTLEFTDVRHNGAQVIRGFPPPVIYIRFNVPISHKLNGTVPKEQYQNKLKLK